jgi:hypothetical protein
MPGTERSFLAGETEGVFVITSWGPRMSLNMDLRMPPEMKNYMRAFLNPRSALTLDVAESEME